MSGIYNPLVVFLSFIIAFLASYTALELSGRLVLLPNARQRFWWLLGGAAAMGVGIWSMHFIGMIAFSLPIPVGYDLLTTAVSLLVSAATSLLALATVSGRAVSRMRLCVAGTIMGMGIAGMHYMGMAAMQMCPPIRYTSWVVMASVAIAIAASMTALWLAFTLRTSEQPNLVFKRLGAAIVMGLAIGGMHYTGMDAANFAAGSLGLSTHQIDADWLALAVLASSMVVLIGTLIFIGLHTNRLSDSLKHAHSQLQYLGTHDPLTELPNRLLLTGRIQQAIDACAHGGQMFAVLFVDLDGFKSINDSLGHAVGDDLLKTCGDRLRRILRHDDMIARIGGDEFVIVMDRLLEASAAGAVANSALHELCQEIEINGVRLRVSASIGIAVFPRDGHNVETLLHSADVAMYSAKQSGRNTFRHFEPSMNTSALKTLILQHDLQRALEEGQLSVSFQPKFRIADRSLSGAEALLRWHHPDLGDIPPLEFIPVAERSGQIIQIGDWVIKEVCRMISDLDASGLPAIQIAINLSPIQFNLRDLVERIDDIVRSAGIAPERMMFEITESVAMQNMDKTSATIQKFRAFGYDMAIDDFGTGYSSLAYLQQFSIKQIKVDRIFVQGLDVHEREGLALVSTIVNLARALDMDVVAEGVETETQMERLASLDCDQMQGFLLSKPLPAAAFQQFLSGVAGLSHHELQPA
ncbi:putative bifunctional diguanylate cyclase/phosphodiesterase [Pararobbsia alpina]|uniref:Putative signaling protein n=1 Tax=Pararobbsia alpina TaxID=621374 RepID=A0A6S7B6D4_9BURK|nr:EAL domain-containing protein [Pararobbsia alpina]CAB3789596.1 putative signaling protein [Pararobbsia alpina]